VSEHSVKIFLILFICLGLYGLIVGVYLKISAVKSPNPARVRVMARKYLLRGIATALLSLLAYVLVLGGLLAPWLILVVLVALLMVIEVIIVRALNLNVTISEQ
jgi:hypothetical protein